MVESSPADRPQWNDEDYSLLLGAIERLETAWKELPSPKLADFLPTPRGDPRSIRMLVRLIEVDRRWQCRRGMKKELAAYVAQWPELQGNTELAVMFDETIVPPALRPPTAKGAAHDASGLTRPASLLQPWAIRILCPNCQQRIEIVDDRPDPEMECPSCGSGFSLADRGIPLDHSQGSPARIRRRVAHFELVDQLGMGAFGSVWKARDTELDKLVALKIPRTAQIDPDASERFIREARAAGRLLHPNIVNVQAVGRDGDLLYIVSEFIDGNSLDKWKVGRTLDFEESARLCAKIVDALQFAHEHGIIHRDLKPHNILMDEAGEPHLTDFGLAKREAEMTMTIEGQVLGTPAYMSPEQARGRGHEADGRSDVYCLGVMLFELLTGLVPFRGTRIAVCRQHEESEPPLPRGLNHLIPRDLETICLKCLEKDPRRRYQSAADLAIELRCFLEGRPILARPVSRPERLLRWCKRQPVVAGLVAATAIALVAGTIISSCFAIRADKNATGWHDAAIKATTNAKRADLKAAEAEDQKNRAEMRLLHVRTAQYDIQILLAQRDLAYHNSLEAEDLLTQCDPNLRGWEHRYLWADVVEGRMVCSGPITNVAFTADRERILAGIGCDKTVNVWDVATGGEVSAFDIKTPFDSVVFGSDGRRVASRSKDGTVKVWDAATGQETRTLTMRGKVYSAVGQWTDAGRMPSGGFAFSPDGQRIAAGGFHDVDMKGRNVATGQDEIERLPMPVIMVWDAATGRQILMLDFFGPVGSLAFSADGQRIVAGGFGSLKVYDVAAGRKTPVLDWSVEEKEERASIHPDIVYSVAFSPDGKRIVSGSSTTVKIWDASTGQKIFTLKGHADSVNSVVFSRDGKWVVSGSDDATVKVWDAATGQERFTLEGHRSAVSSVAVSPDGKRIVSGSYDKTVKVWDAIMGHDLKVWRAAMTQETLTLPRAKELAFSPNGRQIVLEGPYGEVEVRDAITGQKTLALKRDAGNDTTVVFSPDGQRIATSTRPAGLLFPAPPAPARVKVWNATTGQEISTLTGHTDAIESVVFSPDGRRIVTGSKDKTVKVWDAATGQEIFTLAGHTNAIKSVVFSPDGKRIVSGSEDKTVKVWDAATGQEILTLAGHTNAIKSAVFSLDGKRIVSNSSDYTVKVWDAATGQELFSLTGQKNSFNSVVFSPDGKRFVFGDEDKTAKVWDVTMGQELFVLTGHKGDILSVVFSPDGKRIVSGSKDQTVKIWDAATGQELLTLAGNKDSVSSVVFSPNGRWIVSCSSANCTVKVWDSFRADQYQ